MHVGVFNRLVQIPALPVQHPIDVSQLTCLPHPFMASLASLRESRSSLCRRVGARLANGNARLERRVINFWRRRNVRRHVNRRNLDGHRSGRTGGRNGGHKKEKVEVKMLRKKKEQALDSNRSCAVLGLFPINAGFCYGEVNSAPVPLLSRPSRPLPALPAPAELRRTLSPYRSLRDNQ